MTAVRVAILDDQPVYRAGLELVIGGEPGLEVVCAVREIGELSPDTDLDVVLISLAVVTPGPAVPLVSALARRGPAVAIVDDTHLDVLAALIRVGVRGLLTRRSEPPAIVGALTAAARGGLFVAPDLVPALQDAVSRAAAGDAVTLAPREEETLRWLADGCTHTQIARRMGLTPATVNTYVKRLWAKLGAGNKGELVRRGIELGHLADERRHSAA